MSKEQIRFLSLGIESYAKISKKIKAQVNYPKSFEEQIKSLDPDGGVILVFPNGYNVTVLEADQGEGKSSVITCLREMMGNISAPANAVNSDDNEKRAHTRLIGKDGRLYEVRTTKSTFVLEEIETEEDGITPKLNEKNKEIKSEKKSPKELIVKLVGPAGVDPMTLKNMSGADQIIWIRSLYSLDTESLRLEIDIKQKRQKAYEERTKANTQYKNYKTLVERSTDFREQDWEENEKYFNETTFDDINEKIKTVQKNYDQYRLALTKVEGHKDHLKKLEEDDARVDEQIVDIEEQIKRLQQRLVEKQEEKKSIDAHRQETNTKISVGEKWIEENKGVEKENEDITIKVKDASDFAAKKERWLAWVENKKQMDHFSGESVRLTHIIDEYDKAKRDFIKSFTPNVPDLEICIPDDEEKREGIYYKAKPSSYWSESEAWELCTQMWEQLGTRIIFVENISSLGSVAIAKFNEFAANGGYIFGSLMNRKEKNLKITIANQLPE